jgi:hypothetical protein
MKINRFVIMSAYKSNKSAIENTLATAKLLTVYGDAALVQGRFKGNIEYGIQVPVESLVQAREYAAHMKAYFDQECMLYVEAVVENTVVLGGLVHPDDSITLHPMEYVEQASPQGNYTLSPNGMYLQFKEGTE